jgi:hypothetical protein
MTAGRPSADEEVALRARERRHGGTRLGDDLIERRLRREAISDNRDVQRQSQQAVCDEREVFLAVPLPIAAVKERERRRITPLRRKEVERRTRRRTVANVEDRARCGTASRAPFPP